MWQKAKNIYHLAQAFLAAIYFGFPSKKLTVIGVTGTDGKTTTVSMINHVLNALGQKASMVSSVGAQLGSKSIDTGFHVTTPSPWQVQKLIKKAYESGSKYFVLEATSHGLDQNRLAFVSFRAAVLTNITHEHLDYHKTLEKYAMSKSKLFKNVQFSVLNMADQSYELVKNLSSGKVVSYSISQPSDFNLENVNLKLNVKGHYNVQNALASYAVLTCLSFPKAKIVKALNNFKGVKGRFEQIDMGQDYIAVVDFAHTPNSLENILKSLKNELKSDSNRLIAMFGAAGERDKSKREFMGEVSARLANITIITAEDPRKEDPYSIAQEIAKGFIKRRKKENQDFFIVTNRNKAIERAVNLANSGDVIGFFGKGHEKSMCVGKKELPWNEVKAVEKAIRKREKNAKK